ncbi:MAG: hypothetical protein LUC48_04120 [Clostridiales bacterium]|nr:hypothetical protein [Clostridiales bacterium]
MFQRKKYSIWILVVLAALLLAAGIAVAVSISYGSASEKGSSASLSGGDATAAGSSAEQEASFTLNGESFPASPVLQDLLDCNWVKGYAIERSGTSPDGVAVPEVLYDTGYHLELGENYIEAYLVEADVHEGLPAEDCRLRSLSLYGEDVDSFCFNGQELAGADADTLLSIMGEPYQMQEQFDGDLITYSYSFPEQGISSIAFQFSGSSEEVQQILVTYLT